MIILFPNHQLSLKASTPTRYVYEKVSPTRAPVKNIKINSFRVNYQVPAASKNRQRRKKKTQHWNPLQRKKAHIYIGRSIVRESSRAVIALDSPHNGAPDYPLHTGQPPRGRLTFSKPARACVWMIRRQAFCRSQLSSPSERPRARSPVIRNYRSDLPAYCCGSVFRVGFFTRARPERSGVRCEFNF